MSGTLILGMARSGQAAARLLMEEGKSPRLADSKLSQEDLPSALRDLDFRGGAFREEFFEGIDTLILSPGVPLDSLPVHVARRRGIRVSGELEEAFSRTRRPVMAITGSNGKSTTTTLASLLLEASGLRAPACGNLGTPLSDAIVNHPDADVWVVEVSSFQAETFSRFHPRSASLLNLTPDHLDRYVSMEAYARAKLACFSLMKEEDTLVLDESLEERLSFCPSRRLRFSRKDSGGEGAFLLGDDLCLRFGGKEDRVLPLAELALAGEHNLLNALAALALSLPLGLKPGAAGDVLREFSGLPHRMESLGVLGPLNCFNDSKATNVEATLASLGKHPRPFRLIAGGRDKGGDFSLLAGGLPRLKRVYAIGEASGKILEAFGDRALACETLERAIKKARQEGSEGEDLILSPACSSFDQFRDFEDRGDRFRDLIRELS
ncbi:MAG: UDP-N-acetylmuramoyl-L-alanine--D-glutamate ligase [Candidatus Krumholzibacteria bacterium]|jgi:UDP-N-acetylmuramoylalanine--D-glutamate ligase|nr:UDP-N-acetylmuramoyl-L-alanine--D-glutamate ligase [Candidatus Krumholzibacteria bacterium]MDP6669421.1 UDP-N-acetylmuramoyl-L-alanine--D-glutamate ligase [Candidatus Krumholzibacteria bacterium]MDP6797883.1 UDP-N-acetylmuramoyl-L-alanine--D-glutamate ligase [Candidatus Krumholzibacteria bacterium]MDP7021618.1 UDP-N-acetylmuramoyl-L-alanine--D-glutamate ligase [Candidatus Krumholzibacteria bacterium]